jgi:methionyl-tRNA formyltransferase
MLAPMAPDLILVLGWSWKLPAEVIALPRLGTINWHAALLPRYRGRGDWVLQWILRNDEPNYGLTFHWVDADIDTGPILVQAPIPIGDDDDVNSLNDRLLAASLEVLPSVIDMAVRGEPGAPQPDGGFYCGPIEPEWRTIDWHTSARTVHNQVRSWLGDGADASVDGRSLRITRTRLLPAATTGATPGTMLPQRDGSLWVQCADGPIEILAYFEQAATL